MKKSSVTIFKTTASADLETTVYSGTEIWHLVVIEEEAKGKVLVNATTSGTVDRVDGVTNADFNTLKVMAPPKMIIVLLFVEETTETEEGITTVTTAVVTPPGAVVLEFVSNSRETASASLVKTVNTPTTFLSFKLATPMLQVQSADMATDVDFYTKIQALGINNSSNA